VQGRLAGAGRRVEWGVFNRDKVSVTQDNDVLETRCITQCSQVTILHTEKFKRGDHKRSVLSFPQNGGGGGGHFWRNGYISIYDI
jgi:hypothetical protein